MNVKAHFMHFNDEQYDVNLMEIISKFFSFFFENVLGKFQLDVYFDIFTQKEEK